MRMKRSRIFLVLFCLALFQLVGYSQKKLDNHFWLSGAFSPATNIAGVYGIGGSGGLYYNFNRNLVSVKMQIAQEDRSSIWEENYFKATSIGFTYGKLRETRFGYVSAEVGIGYTYFAWYNRFSTAQPNLYDLYKGIGFPFELQATGNLCKNKFRSGIGLGIYGTVSKHSYIGLELIFQLGKMPKKWSGCSDPDQLALFYFAKKVFYMSKKKLL